MSHSSFADAFRAGARFAHPRDGELVMARHVVGELVVRSGRIAACDPFIADWAARDDGLVRRVPTGRFPVELALAVGDPARLGTRVAAARVRFADAPAVRWELARCEPGSAARSSIAELDGYGVDAGTGCFYDPMITQAAVDDATTEGWIAALDPAATPGWGAHLATVGDGTVAMFTSGDGDGMYQSYWGEDAEGKLVELVTDFDLLLEPDEVALPLPATRGEVAHPLLAAHGLIVRRGWWRRATITRARDATGHARIALSDGTRVPGRAVDRVGTTLRFRWPRPAVGVEPQVIVTVGYKPMVAVG